ERAERRADDGDPDLERTGLERAGRVGGLRCGGPCDRRRRDRIVVRGGGDGAHDTSFPCSRNDQSGRAVAGRCARGAGPVATSCDTAGRRRSASCVALVSMLGSTDMPGRSRPLSSESSSAILTGMRWTILVKLPVALSGGSSANSRPLAGDRLSTCPVSSTPGKVSTAILTGWPSRTWVSWVSLKFATT